MVVFFSDKIRELAKLNQYTTTNSLILVGNLSRINHFLINKELLKEFQKLYEQASLMLIYAIAISNQEVV